MLGLTVSGVQFWVYGLRDFLLATQTADGAIGRILTARFSETLNPEHL